MPLDPSIPLGAKVAQIDNPYTQFAQLQQLRAQAEERAALTEARRLAGEEARSKAQEAKAARARAAQVEQTVRGALRAGPDGRPTLDWPTLIGADLPPDVLFTLDKETSDAATRLATLQTANLGLDEKKTLKRAAVARPVVAAGYAKPAWDAAVLAAFNAGAITAAERDAGYALTSPADIQRATDAAITAAAGEQDVITVETVEGGVPGTKIVPKVAGGFYPAAPKATPAGEQPSFQDIDATVTFPDGKTYTGKVGYNPKANVYAPIGSTTPFPEGTRVVKAPTPVDPTLDAIRELTLSNLQRNQGSMTPAQFSMATRLADDYTQASKDYVVRAQAYQTLKDAAANPSAAGDIVMIFAFMKLQDPTSTVREGEAATAQNAAGIPERIRGMYNNALRGERLTDVQRADFVNQSRIQFAQAQSRQRGVVTVYTQRASRAGLNPADVVIDYDQIFKLPPETPGGGGSGSSGGLTYQDYVRSKGGR